MRLRRYVTFALAAACLGLGSFVGNVAAQEPPGFAAALDTHRARIIDVRRDIHRHPDPSGREARTAGVVAGVLERAGFDVTTGVGGHGVVGVLRTAVPGPVLAFRADMDAVSDPARDPMEFRSVNAGVNHTCGHDIHTAVGLALGVGLAEVRDELAGTIVLIFQPAEETATGANAMLADGLFGAARARGASAAGGSTRSLDVPVPDAIFAYHAAPYPVGVVATRPGTLLPGRDRVRVTIRGDGDLDAPAREAWSLVNALATVGSSEPVRPATEDFIRVGGARVAQGAGGSRLVVATLTSSGPPASRGARERLERGLAALRGDGIDVALEYEEGWIAGIRNDPALTGRALAIARGALGDEAVREPQALSTIFSEDFGSFQRHVPGVMYFLGVSNEERGWVGMPHTPTFVADEEAIFVGARVMAAVFFDLMRQGVPE